MAGIGERDVLVDGAVEQQVLLQHDADLAAQPRRDRPGAMSMPSMKHLPALGPVEPLDQLGQRRLARARRADDAEHLRLAGISSDMSFKTSGPSGR